MLLRLLLDIFLGVVCTICIEHVFLGGYKCQMAMEFKTEDFNGLKFDFLLVNYGASPPHIIEKKEDNKIIIGLLRYYSHTFLGLLQWWPGEVYLEMEMRDEPRFDFLLINKYGTLSIIEKKQNKLVGRKCYLQSILKLLKWLR